MGAGETAARAAGAAVAREVSRAIVAAEGVCGAEATVAIRDLSPDPGREPDPDRAGVAAFRVRVRAVVLVLALDRPAMAIALEKVLPALITAAIVLPVPVRDPDPVPVRVPSIAGEHRHTSPHDAHRRLLWLAGHLRLLFPVAHPRRPLALDAPALGVALGLAAIVPVASRHVSSRVVEDVVAAGLAASTPGTIMIGVVLPGPWSQMARERKTRIYSPKVERTLEERM